MIRCMPKYLPPNLRLGHQPHPGAFLFPLFTKVCCLTSPETTIVLHFVLIIPVPLSQNGSQHICHWATVSDFLVWGPSQTLSFHMLSPVPHSFLSGSALCVLTCFSTIYHQTGLTAEFIRFPKGSPFFNDAEMAILVFDYCNYTFSIATLQMVNQSVQDVS